MRITLTDAGKRFNRDWIFRHLSYEFTIGHSYAITGPNGSGKSTLLQAIAGALGISEGIVRYEKSPLVLHSIDRPMPSTATSLSPDVISPDQVYRHLALAAPYLEVIEEMTVLEFLEFHGSFKPFLPGNSVQDIIGKVGLDAAAHKQIRYYSSGMKQRVRLAQALFSDTPVVLLDEPCTNLDIEGITLYRRLIGEYAAGRLVIVSSNDRQEYDFCEENINIMDYK
jgi:ABC-type multidrug transport system ATPase subunit